MQKSKHLRRKLYIAIVAILVALFATVTATFAWYIYNTRRHTTNVQMAAGAGLSLQIANTYDGTYRQAALLDAFVGRLNPVSTDRITNGFQKVYGYTYGDENQSNLVASIFGASDNTDYYKTSLFLKTNAGDTQVYLADIGYEDSDEANPISTAIRVGFVVHEPGNGTGVANQFIFAINDGENPQADYNTATGEEGHVLDSTKTDGTTVAFTPKTSANYCRYDDETGEITLLPQSLPICSVTDDGTGDYGEAVQVDVYIWLEGCDKDCTNNLGDMTLRNLALSFAGQTQ